jgi:hypothetical protein
VYHGFRTPPTQAAYGTDKLSSTAGFVGLRNLDIDNLAISGQATIETLTVQAGDAGLLPVGTALVRMGFSNLDISMASLNTEVALGNRKDNLNQFLGSVYLGGLEMGINGSVNIYTPSASTQGIVLGLDANFSKLKLDTLSWGDADGIGLGTADPVTHTDPTAGFRGWRSLVITGMKVNGNVEIDVATVTDTTGANELVYHAFRPQPDQMYAAYQTGKLSPTFVHIGLGTGNADNDPALPGALAIGMTSLTATVVVDRSRSLDSPQAGELRTLNISGMAARINGWVDIGAH